MISRRTRRKRDSLCLSRRWSVVVPLLAVHCPLLLPLLLPPPPLPPPPLLSVRPPCQLVLARRTTGVCAAASRRRSQYALCLAASLLALCIQQGSDGTVSYDPSDEDGPSEVPNEESNDALMHAQTHSARATFFVAECVLSREHWAIPYCLTLPTSAAGGTDSSPPRGGSGGTSARRPTRISSGRMESRQLIHTIAEELAECDA